jgi:outer membrane protein TolC
MRRQFSSLVVSSAAILCAAIGCSPQQPFYFSRPNGGDHYVGVAQQIEYPDLETASLDEVNGAKAPLTIDNPKPDSYWDLSLEEAIHIALQNSSVIRTLGMAGTLAGGVELNPTGMVGTPSSLLNAPQAAATIYIPALAEADPRFGVEAALAAFDAQLSSSIFWEKNIVPQNTSGFVSTFRPPTFKQDVGNSTTEISKTTATGDQFAIRNNIRYTLDNVPAYPVPGAAKRWPNEWLAEIQAEFRHPFLQGAGVGFNRIAGPGAIPGQANGVMIARLRTDQSLADFEASVRNLCGDVEKAYWYLYYAYRRLDSVIAGRDAALQTWRQAKARFDVGGKGGGAQEEAQARQNFLLFETTVEQAQSNLYKTENALRYMLGLSHTDGRLIRPSDEPTTAKVEFDWYDAHAEALTRSVELRKQKWVIKQRELELIAAKNYLLPRLDAVGRYSFSGMGDMLIDPSRNLEPRDPASAPPDLTAVPHSAYGAMTTGDYPSWHLGLEFRMPFGFRREMAGVRFAQLNLMRERKILQEQELELSHQLADAFRDLSQNYMLSQKSYNRWLAARREVEAVQAAYEVGTTTLDQVLDAQRRQAEAENEYYRNLVQYNLSITLVHFRKGSLLEYDGIYLAEGPWPAKAYFDAPTPRSPPATPRAISTTPLRSRGFSAKGLMIKARATWRPWTRCRSRPRCPLVSRARRVLRASPAPSRFLANSRLHRVASQSWTTTHPTPRAPNPRRGNETTPRRKRVPRTLPRTVPTNWLPPQNPRPRKRWPRRQKCPPWTPQFFGPATSRLKRRRSRRQFPSLAARGNPRSPPKRPNPLNLMELRRLVSPRDRRPTLVGRAFSVLGCNS